MNIQNKHPEKEIERKPEKHTDNRAETQTRDREQEPGNGKPIAQHRSTDHPANMVSGTPDGGGSGDLETPEAEIQEIRDFMEDPRFQEITRLYSPFQVWQQRGSIATEYPVARNAATGFFTLLRDKFRTGESITTFGPYSPGQAVAMKRKGIEAIYLGGWATSAKGSESEDPGADLAAYPLSRVPREAAAIVRALLSADKNQRYALSVDMQKREMETGHAAAARHVDFSPFIIADADTGHGGDAHVRNLIRRFVEAGVPGYHIEDQRPGTKKCGHQGGKVLVSVDEQIKRLNAARFQLDIMGVPGIIVARSDAEAATLLDNNKDGRDHPFILGAVNTEIPPYSDCYVALMRELHCLGLRDVLGHRLYMLSDEEEAQARAWLDGAGVLSRAEEAIAASTISSHGAQRSSQEDEEIITNSDDVFDGILDMFVESWEKDAVLKTYPEAVRDRIRSRNAEMDEGSMSEEDWMRYAGSVSFPQARAKAREMGVDCPWDWEKSRTTEGYYQVRGGIDYAIRKSLAVAPFADILWMETKTADLADARKFARAVHERYPGKMLAYNLSPSFNWDTTGMSDEEMRDFPLEIGKLGFVFNFITYGGHQIDGLAAEDFSTALVEDGMLGLARLQRKFRLLNSPYTTPQTLVGGPRLDAALAASSGRTATTKAMGKGSTQFQHLKHTELPLSVLESWLAEWTAIHRKDARLRCRLRPIRSGSEILQLRVEDQTGRLIADVVFTTMQDRRGRNILVVRDQNSHEPSYRKKRLMTLVQLYLITRYESDTLHYVTPNDMNRIQTERMMAMGLFTEVKEEIGDIIVGRVNREFVRRIAGGQENGGSGRSTPDHILLRDSQPTVS